MSQHLSTAIVPVSAEEISRRSYEQQYLIEERILLSLVEVVNQGIREQVSHGLLEYEFCVPSFIYGFPKFDVAYVGEQLRSMYADRGFQVSGTGRWVHITWSSVGVCFIPHFRSTTPRALSKRLTD